MREKTFIDLLALAGRCANLISFRKNSSAVWKEEFPTAKAQGLNAATECVFTFSRNFNFPAVREYSGLSQKGFATVYKIPRRSVENWEYGTKIPDYLLLLLAADVVERLVKG